MKTLIALTLLATTVAATGIVRSESLEDKKYWQKQTDYINEKLASANKACDAHFSFEFTGRDQLRADAEKGHHSPNGVCGDIVDEVARICRNEGADGKKAVQDKIKGFVCSSAKPRNLDLSGGILKYAGNEDESNFSDWAKPWLMKHL